VDKNSMIFSAAMFLLHLNFYRRPMPRSVPIFFIISST
jgi:hypothetical protein